MKFKKTKIGLVPEDWEVKEVKKVFDFLKTYSFSRKNLDNNSEIFYIHYGEIHKNYKFHLDFTKHSLPKISKNFFKNDIEYLREGDLVIVDASEDYEGIAESIEIQKIGKDKVVAGLHTFALRDKNNNFANGYKGYIFYNKEVKKTLKKIATGISVLGISKKELSNILIPLPPLKEQKKIATILSTCDEMIEKQEKLIKEKEKLKKALMQKLLNVEVNGELKKLPKVRFKEFSGEWENGECRIENGEWVEKRLGEVGAIYQPKTISEKEFKKNAYPVYGANGKIGYYDKYNHEKWQVIITCRGSTCGTVNKTENKSWITGNSMVINVDENKNINKLFLYYLLQIQNFYKIIEGSGQPQITQKSLQKFKIHLSPTLKEQEKIADVLSTLDKEIDLLKLELEEYKKLKKSFMQKLLTGKVRVRV